MRIPGKVRLRRAVRRFIGSRDALILMYHRVSESGPDPWGLSVSPRHFSDHLEVLRRHASPMPLQYLTSSHAWKGRSPRALAITFDDGYADNLLAAAPLLRRHDIPATVFVATASIGKPRGFWWDELADLLLLPGQLPEALELTISGRAYRWRLGRLADYPMDTYQRYRSYPAWQDPPTERHATYTAIWRLLQTLPTGVQREVLDALTEWAGTAATPKASHRMLTEVEVTALGQDGLIEIGAHTMTHPVLPTLSLDAQRREVMESKACLERIVNRVVDSFAYPYGQTSTLTAAVVREAAFERACTTQAGLVGSQTDRFHLPRISVPDCDGEDFAERLSRAFA